MTPTWQSEKHRLKTGADDVNDQRIRRDVATALQGWTKARGGIGR